MKKSFSFFGILISAILGAGLMYYLLEYSPLIDRYKGESDGNVKVERNVTVTDTGINEGIENVYNSVVVVENYRDNKLTGIGSGFIYDSEGYIMTNHHVIDKASKINVILMDGESLEATLIGSDEYADIAVLKIDKKYVKSVVKIGNSDNTKLGDTVFTIGSPMSSTYAGTVTRGILSGKNRMVEVSVKSNTNDYIMNVMQTDAAINPGNSGGPLCNINGEVIGVNTMKIVESEIEGIGFAIPIEDAIAYAKQILSGEKIKRAYLGISMGDIGTSNYYLRKENIVLDKSIEKGVVIIGLSETGPCGRAGMLKGDVIIKIGKYDVKNVAELKYYLFKYKPEDIVDIVIIRGTEQKTYKVTLGESK